MTTLQIISLCLTIVSLVAAAANLYFISKAEKELDKAIKAQKELYAMRYKKETEVRDG